MDSSIFQTSKAVWIRVNHLYARPTIYHYDSGLSVQKREGFHQIIRFIFWSIILLPATAIALGFILQEFGYYGVSNWCIDAIYGASTIIMEMLGWK